MNPAEFSFPRRTLLGAAAMSVAAFPREGHADTALPSHPRLLVSAAGVAHLKKRVAEIAWVRGLWEVQQKEAVANVSLAVELPPRGGNWSHNYVCPVHGARLKKGRKVGPWEWEHLCPEGNHVLRGDTSKATLDFDGNAISTAHSGLAQQITQHGLVFQVTGDVRHAVKAKEILLAYAARYLTYPLHDNQGKPGSGGRVASQSLTEASWLIEMAQGADLVWQTLSASEQKTVADKLLYPALNEIIIPRKFGIHNIQNRHNSAIGLVGFLLNDQTLITRAIDDPATGFHQQMERGVLDDGMWLEGSAGYHFFTLDGVWPLTEAARNCGKDLYGPKLQAMFDAPLALAMPNFVLPDFNDSNEVPLENQAHLYELGYARYRKPAYTALLGSTKREGRLALLFGEATLPQGNLATLASRNSEASGYAVLQKGKSEAATWLCVKYGPHGGGHGHPDKNQTLVYARGQVLAPDGGTHAYGSPLHNGWDKATAAHNTLVVDETSQKSAQGKCLTFGSEQGVDFAVTHAGDIYPGVRFFRSSALLTPHLIVFVDQVFADAPHTFDIAYHQLGTWGDIPAGEKWAAPSKPGYQFLRDAARYTPAPNRPVRLPIAVHADWKTAVHIAPHAQPGEIITGYGIRKTTNDRVPFLLQRRTNTRKTTFVWLLDLDTSKNGNVTLEANPAKETDEATIVRVQAGKEKWLLLANPLAHKTEFPVPPGPGVWVNNPIFAARKG